jgi:hypothetical protein
MSLLLAGVLSLTLTGSLFSIVLVFRSGSSHAWVNDPGQGAPAALVAESALSRASAAAVLLTLLIPLVPCLFLSISSYTAREYNKKDVLKVRHINNKQHPAAL